MENGKQHTDPVVYTARGRICGIYRPSATNFLEGILLTDDGLKIPAQLTPEVASQLRANQDFLKVAQVWNCYPRIEPPWVMLVKLKSKAQTVQELKRKGVNKFRIVGQVLRIKGKEVTVLIKRNELPPEGEESSFTVTIVGDLPKNAVGQFWRFNVRREGWNWRINSATFVAASPEVLEQQLNEQSRFVSVKVTYKEFQAIEAYAKKYRKTKTYVIKKLIQKLPTYEPDR